MTSDSIETARETTDVRIPDPEIPESYRLEVVRVTSAEDAERVHLQYARGEETIRLARSEVGWLARRSIDLL